ncbi:MAG: biopolymer transport protein ExbD [Myxococcota bacterium]|jgi:biopolymer transport protein ExbD
MGSKFAGDDDLIADINITPFVDIILVVLIVFMVTASVVPMAVQANLPSATTGEAMETTSIGLTLMEDGRLLMDGVATTPNAFIAALDLAFADDPDTVVLIAAEELVAHGRVVWAMDVIKSSGISKFAFNIDPSAIIEPDPATMGLGSGR